MSRGGFKRRLARRDRQRGPRAGARHPHGPRILRAGSYARLHQSGRPTAHVSTHPSHRRATPEPAARAGLRAAAPSGAASCSPARATAQAVAALRDGAADIVLIDAWLEGGMALLTQIKSDPATAPSAGRDRDAGRRAAVAVACAGARRRRRAGAAGRGCRAVRPRLGARRGWRRWRSSGAGATRC